MLVWMRQLGYIDSVPSQRKSIPAALPNSAQETAFSDQDAAAKVAALEAELARLRLQAEGYEEMLNWAEETYQLPIRKKLSNPYFETKTSTCELAAFMWIIWHFSTSVLSALATS